MLRFIAQPLAVVALSTLLLAAPQQVAAINDNSGYNEFSKQFVNVAKKATPCVVSIKTQVSQKKWAQRNDIWEDPIDPLADELWGRLFGIPSIPRPDKKAPKLAHGSGFVISSDGYIFTNNHLVQDAEKITVIFNNGKEYPATLVGGDANTDIALVKIETTNLPTLVLSDSSTLEVGEWVIAIGNPLGLRSTVSTGIVSATGRNDLDIATIEEFIQTDASINPGNSGGCLLNLKGEVVGMNTAIATNNGGSIGIGFAIPSNLLEHVKEQLLKSGKVTRGYLGIILQPTIDSDLAEAFNLENNSGALITEVVKDSPAEKAGLLAGDVITKLNDKPIPNAATLRNTVAMMAPNDKLTLIVKRNDKELKLVAMVGAFSENELTTRQVENNIGLIVDTLTPELARKFGYREEEGVIVRQVQPDSLAFDAGLHKGDLILTINRKPIQSADEFYGSLKSSLASSNQVLLYVKRGQSARFVSIRTP